MRATDGRGAAPAIRLEDVDLDGAAPEVRALLDAGEWRRAGEFRSQAARDQYIAGRAALRLTLARLLGCNAGSISFGREQYGKPYLSVEGPPRCHFNLSHTSGRVLIAVSFAGEVGVDIEATEAEWPPVLLARLRATPAIAWRLAALPPQAHRAALCEYWVRKEAYAKALGTGIALELAQDTPDFGGDPAKVTDRHGHAWWIRGVDVGPRYRAAVCARHPAPVTLRRRSLSWLLADAA